MNARTTALRWLGPVGEASLVRATLRGCDDAVHRWQHALAKRLPTLIRPGPRQLTVAITAACNLKCAGCRYGRDFMVGEMLDLDLVKDMLIDARAAGVLKVRYYGGEPLLHPDVVEMVRFASKLGLEPYLTTNGLLLGDRIVELVDAGLRWASIGFYGIGDQYDRYVQRAGQFERLQASLARVRERVGDRIDLQLNYVAIRPLADLETLERTWAFAERHSMCLHVDLSGTTIPFFRPNPEVDLGFVEADRPRLTQIANRLVELKLAHPDRVPHAPAFLRSIPDWLILGTNMRVPCDAYELIWVGADGSVKLCDVYFPLGNLREQRLRDMLFTETHKSACRDAFGLKCPNCTCKVDSRIRRDGPSFKRYSR